MSYVLAIDQGTTSSRVLIYDQSFKVVGKGQHAFPQHYPEQGWVEHDLEEIWQSVLSSMKEAIDSVNEEAFSLDKIKAIGITNQRETFAFWNRKTGKPIGRAVVWQCNRSEADCAKLKKTATAKKIEKITGLKIAPYFSATKAAHRIKADKKLREGIKKGSVVFGNIDTFLIWRLSGGKSFATDTSNASRTLMMDLKTQRWHPLPLKTFGLTEEALPEIKASDAEFGRTKGLGVLPDGISINGVLGDQQAALFGQSCFKKGEAKITYGTGAFMLINTGDKVMRSKTGVSTVAWTLGGKTTYALEASVFIAGAAVQFVRDNLLLIKKSNEIEGLARSEKNSGGSFFIPALTGLGSPYWAPQAKGLIGGLTRATTKGHLARACLEGIAHSIADVFSELSKDAKSTLKSIRVDGGASMNSLLMQEQADYLRVKIERPKDVETTVRGAAAVAALGAGLCSMKDLRNLSAVQGSWKSQIKKSETLSKRKTWKRRIKGLLSGAY